MPPRGSSAALAAKYSELAASPHDGAPSCFRPETIFILLSFLSAGLCRRMTAISCKTIISAMHGIEIIEQSYVIGKPVVGFPPELGFVMRRPEELVYKTGRNALSSTTQ